MKNHIAGIPAKVTNASALVEEEESLNIEMNFEESPVGIILKVDPFVSKMNSC